MKKIFSNQEVKVISALGFSPKTIRLLVEQLYKKYSLEKANQVGMVIRRVNAKCVRHDLNFFIEGVGGGRGGKLIWRQPI